MKLDRVGVFISLTEKERDMIKALQKKYLRKSAADLVRFLLLKECESKKCQSIANAIQ